MVFSKIGNRQQRTVIPKRQDTNEPYNCLLPRVASRNGQGFEGDQACLSSWHKGPGWREQHRKMTSEMRTGPLLSTVLISPGVCFHLRPGEEPWQSIRSNSAYHHHNDPTHYTPGYLSRRQENIYPYKDLYTNVHQSFIYKEPKIGGNWKQPK